MKRTLIFLALFLLLASPAPVMAQGTTPPDSAWGEVVDENGNILYDNLTDLGVVQEPADWMPDVPGFGPMLAEYHAYQTPSGNFVLMPTASTLFFMALNPDASSLGSASVLGNGIGALEMLTAGYLTPDRLGELGYTNSGDFFQAVINGQTNIWTAFGDDTITFLLDLLNRSIIDQSLYTMLLLYTPGQCAQLPGGCPDGASLPPGTGTPPPTSNCSAPTVAKGRILVSAGKTAPNYPLVVGQDEERRGADAWWEVRVEPTIYTWWTEEPVYETYCAGWHTGDPARDCKTTPSMWYNDGVTKTRQNGYTCESHTQVYPEALRWATPSARLSETSRGWILNTLSINYPGAYLHRPDFSWAGNPGAGSLQGNTYVWPFSQTRIQFADPGYFTLAVAGSTTGTPVSDPRGFNLGGGQLDVWLRETTIIR
jgi:hypothetical protein